MAMMAKKLGMFTMVLLATVVLAQTAQSAPQNAKFQALYNEVAKTAGR